MVYKRQGYDPAAPGAYFLAQRAARAPAAPLSSATVGASCVVAGTACVTAPPGAGMTDVPDGSAVRVRVSQNVYAPSAASWPTTVPFLREYVASDAAFTPPAAAYAAASNLRLLKPTNPPRFEILVEGRDPATLVKAASAYRLLGYGTRDLHGGTQYLAPAQWCLNPVPYVILRLLDGQGHTEFNVINSRGTQTSNVLAKILVGGALSQVNQQIQTLGTGGYRNYRRVRLQLLNPDLTPYHFHGADYSISLCFVFDSDDVQLPCV